MGEARLHFGAHQSMDAACIDPLRTDEKERLAELARARSWAQRCAQVAENAEQDQATLAAYREELARLFGDCGGVPARTPFQAWLVLDYAQGEILVLKERLKELGHEY